MKKILLTIFLILILATIALFLYPSPIDSVAWNPPTAPQLSGPTAPNNLLASAELLALGEIYGPEDASVFGKQAKQNTYQ